MSDYIPLELIRNILARLPVDDAVRCTSVCKSWYSLITSPSFASSHLNLSNQEPRVLVRYLKPENRMSSRYCLHRDNQTFDEIAELDVPDRFRGREWRIADSLNGLVCLYSNAGCEIVLWNPSLRKSFVLPKSRVLSNSKVSRLRRIGFGFVATSNDYKIVKFSYASKTESQAEIYELSTGSWHDLKLEKSIGFQGSHKNAHLNGILHWFARNRGEVNPDFTNYICSFNLKNEKFDTLMVPSCLRHDDEINYDDDDDDDDDDYYYDDPLYSFLSTFKESLCLIEYDSDRLCTIWLMKEYGVADSWQKLFHINTDIEDHDLRNYYLINMLYFRHNGGIMFSSYCLNSSEPGLISYDCKNNQIKNVGLLVSCLSINTYVDNLFLIKGPNEVKIDEESTNIPLNIQGFSGLLLNQTNESGNGSKIG